MERIGKFRIIYLSDIGQGFGAGVEVGVGVGRSLPFCLESASELESVKFGRLRLRPGVAVYKPSTDNNYGRAVRHRPVEKHRKTLKKPVLLQTDPFYHEMDRK